jgi:protein subunit release factor B
MALDEKTLGRMRRLGLHPGDLEESFSRSSGPGGQHVNKVSTACTLRHLPTGFAITASDSRSQASNRQLALDRLLAYFEAERAATIRQRQADAAKARRQKAQRSRSTKRQMVEAKRKRGETKKLRSRIPA